MFLKFCPHCKKETVTENPDNNPTLYKCLECGLKRINALWIAEFKRRFGKAEWSE